jgi:DNA polymerase gamma 1
MPEYHPFAVMATAASKNAWYAWISPWLLGQSTETRQLILIGDPSLPRIIVGHNVSYDRSRILEEYHLSATKNRFIDTMALHIAAKGISSHQRPAWMKHHKNKELDAQRHDPLDDSEPTKRWEDLTSINSLAYVAKLHCNIEMDKEIRNDFMTSIRHPRLHTYISRLLRKRRLRHTLRLFQGLTVVPGSLP